MENILKVFLMAFPEWLACIFMMVGLVVTALAAVRLGYGLVVAKTVYKWIVNAEEIFLLQEDQSLRHGFEVELLCPTFVANALAFGQLCLNINQLCKVGRFRLYLGFARCVCGQGG